jgi:signal transduction histidine kinase
MKYSPANTSVVIRLTSAAGVTEISVKDEGPGISAKEQSLLFKSYSTTSSVPREGEHQMGLGLAIVKKLANALGGQVGCESTMGKGSRFYISFSTESGTKLSA